MSEIKHLKSPLVSIAIPTFNRPNLLLRALKSVLSQDYNNLEIMIFSDHDSRIAEDRLGSSVIFAKKESNSETSKIITKKTYSNLVFADNYKRIK